MSDYKKVGVLTSNSLTVQGKTNQCIMSYCVFFDYCGYKMIDLNVNFYKLIYKLLAYIKEANYNVKYWKSSKYWRWTVIYNHTKHIWMYCFWTQRTNETAGSEKGASKATVASDAVQYVSTDVRMWSTHWTIERVGLLNAALLKFNWRT